ncbi:MAG TPA: DNA-binding response regulator, partial [Clostridiales bacterium]|nr:DNA-binding response regulator [Clostridiales bacterium]
IFLDIEMPLMDGLNLAHKIRERDDDVSIVFVTNMKQYVIRGYEVDADDFILKPVTYEDFSMKLERVIKKILNKKDIVKFKINDDGVIKFIPLSDIRYVDVYQHKLSFHATDKIYESRGSLNKIEPLFLEHNFVKCSNYCLVNLKYVEGVVDYTLLVSKGKKGGEAEKLTISHLRKKEFMSLLNKYLGVNA